MKNCRCGRPIDEKVIAVFGDLSTCTMCAQDSVLARKAGAAIQQIIVDLYAHRGKDGMAALRKEIGLVLAQFALK